MNLYKPLSTWLPPSSSSILEMFVWWPSHNAGRQHNALESRADQVVSYPQYWRRLDSSIRDMLLMCPQEIAAYASGWQYWAMSLIISTTATTPYRDVHDGLLTARLLKPSIVFPELYVHVVSLNGNKQCSKLMVSSITVPLYRWFQINSADSSAAVL